MTTATRGAAPALLVPSIPEDPALPGAADLLRPEGLGLIDCFLAASGWRLRAARPVQTMYQPGRSLVVRYRAEAVHPAGETRMVWLCAETRRRAVPTLPPPADLDPAMVPAQPVASMGPYLVWSFPYDPTLPALADAGRGPAVQRVLAAMGRPSMGVSVEPVCYRPHRRATFRYTVLAGRGQERQVLYGKVLRPDRADAFMRMAHAVDGGRRRWSPWRRRAGDLRLSLPVADTAGGLLLFEPLMGHSLRDLLLRGASLPDPVRLPRLFDDLAAVGGLEQVAGDRDQPGRRDPARMLRDTHRLLVQITPGIAGRVDRLVGRLEEHMAADPAERRLTHNDLYDAQIFVASDYSLGLLDLDDVGWGDRAMDAANFSAHLLALALAVPAASPVIRAYRRLARPAFMGHLDIGSPSMAWREALVMLLLAPGPFRVLDGQWPSEVARRVELAERLLAQEI